MTKKISILIIFLIFTDINYSFAKFNSYIIKFKNNSDVIKNQNNDNINKINSLSSNLSISKSILVSEKLTTKQILNTTQKANLNNSIKELNTYYELNIKDNSLFNLDEFIEFNGLAKEIEFVTPNFIYSIENEKNSTINNENQNKSNNTLESKISDDSLSDSQWALEQFKAKSVWDIATGLGIKVGVIDTGIDWEHNDLKNQLSINDLEDINKNGKFDAWSIKEKKDGVTGDIDGIDNDKNGFNDDVIGYDFVDQSVFNPGDYIGYDPFPYDENGHGTGVSSIIVAEKDNKIGMAGFAFNSKVITARAFDALGSGESDDIASAIVYCALNGAKVLNLSFGERFKSPIIEAAIKFANVMGCVIVSSSGNNNWWFEHYPSDFQEVISVGASNEKKQRESSISNYGSFVDILAPGSGILVASPGNRYKTSRGTSLSSPYVTALAAMMLEINPELTANEIINIIQTNATDIGKEGWDYENSAGLINPLKTLKNIIKSEVRFLTNSNELYLDKITQKILKLNANIIDPLLDNYQIIMAKGLYPLEKDFEVLDSGFVQVFNQKVLELDLTKLKDTLYTIAIKVNRKNKTDLQYRIKLNINSAFSRLQITSHKLGTVLKDSKREVMFDIYTNQSSYLNIKYKKTSDTVYKSIENYEKYTKNHNLLAEGVFEQEVDYNIQINVFNNNYSDYQTNVNFQTINTIFKIDKNSAFPLDWEMKSYSLPPSYINPFVFRDIDTSSKVEYIVANELVNGNQFGKLYLYMFDKTAVDGKQFSKLDSLNGDWLVVNIGKLNNERVVLTHAESKTRLFKIDNITKRFNQTPIYSNSSNSKEWGAILRDFDGAADTNPEMLCYNDTTFVLYKYVNNKFEILATTPVFKKEIVTSQGTKTVNRYLDIKPVFTYGGFVGGQDLIFELEGNIIDCSFKNNNFVLENVFTYLNEQGKSLYQMNLIKNDDLMVINLAILTSGDADFNTNTQVQNNIWNLELLKLSTNTNGFKELSPIWEERIFGVRDGYVGSLGFSYKNSLNVVDFDNDFNQDIVLCITPNMYVFNNLEYNNLINSHKNIGWSSGVFSSSVYHYDFDKNGKKELGVNFFSGTKFLELKNFLSVDTLPRAISGFTGYPINENSALLEWDLLTPDNNNLIYEVFDIVNFNTGEILKIAETTSNINKITLNNLKENQQYNFLIRALEKSLNSEIKYGSLSFPVIVDIYPHKNISATNIKVLDSMQLEVSFNGKLPKNFIPTAYFKIINNSNNSDTLNVNSVLVLNDTSIVLKLAKSLANANYSLNINSFKDYYRTPTLVSSLSFDFSKDNSNYLYMNKLEVLSNKVRIEFSEDFDENSLNISNFKLTPQGEIINLYKDSEKSNSIIFEISEDVFKNAKGIVYNITCNDLTAISGNKITKGAGSSMSFVLRQNNLNDPYILPNPVRLSINDELTIANLTKIATIEIFDINGNRIAELIENDGDGGFNWDLMNSDKQKIQAGVYLYKISGYNDNGEFYESELSKFMVKD